MAAKTLATVKQLISRINAIEDGDINPLMFQCLSSATIQLIAAIQTKYMDATTGVIEDFQVPEYHPTKSNRYLSFRLSNGFVDEETTPLSMVYGITEDDLTNNTPVDSKYLKVDKEKGLALFDTYENQDSLVSIYNTNGTEGYKHHLFRITYDHGFASKTTKYGGEYTGVPDWLSECALIKAREIYQLTNPRKGQKAEDVSINLSALLDGHIRYFPNALTPVI